MHFYYMDNYRGFQNCLVEVGDVTFCVGENSTGKTSFLTLATLLRSNHFWLEPRPDGLDSAFGHFDDQVSVASKDKSYFRVGFARQKPTISNAGRAAQTAGVVQAVLLSFCREQGLTKLNQVTYINRIGALVRVQLTPKTVRYTVSRPDSPVTAEMFREGLFSKWADEHTQAMASGYSVLKDDASFLSQAPLYFVLASIDLQRGSRQGGGDGAGLPIPLNDNFTWIAPIRSKPKRTYDKTRSDFSPEGDHTPYVIKKMLDGGSSAKGFVDFIRRFGRESGLFKEVNIHRFGESAASPFELEIVLDKLPLNIENVGYGVSQGLPVAVELFVRPEGSWFAVQQPEVHLHPRAQASMGEMVYELASNERKNFIVETHSDFMIDRFRLVQRREKRALSSQVLFFERRLGINRIASIPIDENGEFPHSQPEEYRRFFLDEQLRLVEG